MRPRAAVDAAPAPPGLAPDVALRLEILRIVHARDMPVQNILARAGALEQYCFAGHKPEPSG